MDTTTTSAKISSTYSSLVPMNALSSLEISIPNNRSNLRPAPSMDFAITPSKTPASPINAQRCPLSASRTIAGSER